MFVEFTIQKQPPEVLCKKGVSRNFAKFTRKHLCQTLTQVFFCEFCEISKNTFSYRTPPVAVSDNPQENSTKRFQWFIGNIITLK